MPELHLVDHPLVQHKLTLLRDRTTTTRDFRLLMGEIAAFLCYEATRDLELERVEVETPLERTHGAQVSGKKLGVVAVMRAGVGMLDAVLDLIPVARVGFVGLYRDEQTLEPVEYYRKLPGDLGQRDVLLLDPMLATGGTARPPRRGCAPTPGARRIRLLSIVAAPEGVARFGARCPTSRSTPRRSTVRSTSAGYIMPGLGDAGDRLYGTR